MQNQSGKSTMIKILSYEIALLAADAVQGAAGNTTIIINVFGLGFSQG